jgi:hypothetical protein
VNIQGVIVRITDAAGGQLTTFTRLTSATLNPAVGGAVVYTPVSATIVDPPLLDPNTSPDPDIRTVVNFPVGASGYARVVTYTRFFGHTLGGQYVESNEFEFPVDICNGCLINFLNTPVDIGGQPLGQPNCVVPLGATGAAVNTPQIPCFLGQDLAVDCTGCQQLKACQGAVTSSSIADAGAG